MVRYRFGGRASAAALGATARGLAVLVAVAGGARADGGEVAAVRFVDVAVDTGLWATTHSGSSEKPHLLESTGNGVLVVDFDADGWQDLYLVSAYSLPRPADQNRSPSRLYRNRGDGVFEDVTERAGAGFSGYGHGGCVGDVDVDGDLDLYLTAFGPNALLANDGHGAFVEGAQGAGVEEPGWSIGCALFDGDRDGDLDLFVSGYVEATWDDVAAARRTRRWRDRVAVMDGPRGLPEAANRYFENRGDGTFLDRTASAGFDAGGRGYSMAVAAFDADLDGDVDLYVANDSTPNRFYRNRGDGRFEEVGTESGVAYDGDGQLQGSMGIGVGDLDGNGFPDLVVTNFAHDHATLYSNLDGVLFVDTSFPSGLAAPTFAPLGWAVLPFDADRDGELDLFLANGHIYPQVDEDPSLNESFRQKNQLFLGRSGRLVEVGAGAGPGFAASESSRGAALLDLEGDGDLDLVVSNQDAPPTLLRSEGGGRGQWLLLTSRGGLPVGARAELRAGRRRQVAQRVGAASYASESAPSLHFGLGSAPQADELEVIVEGVRTRRFRRLVPDRVYVLPLERGG